MSKVEITLNHGFKYVIEIEGNDANKKDCECGDKIISYIVNEAQQIFGHTVTCTCPSTGKTVSKVCPTTNALCDCSDPKNPKITCL